MLRIFVILSLLISTTPLFSSEVTPISLSPVFSGVAGTPRVARNETDSVWVVAWRQGSPGKIFARTVSPTGARKTIATGTTSASHSFDIAHDSLANRYLLAFETSKGLQVQLLSANLAKVGAPVLIESSVSNSRARVVFDSGRNQFLLFWLAGQSVKVAQLSSTGQPIAPAKTVATAASGKTFNAMNAVRNGKTGNVLVLLLEISQGTMGAVIGYNVKPDGSLLGQSALQFQAPTASLNTVAEGTFDSSGAGFAFWNDKNLVKFRKISATGSFAGATKSISNPANIDSFQTGVGFDSTQNRLLTVWSEAKQLKSAQLNAKTGAVVQPSAPLASSTLSFSRNVEVSYSPGENAFLAVWEDAGPADPAAGGPDARFRVRAAVIGGSGGGGGGGGSQTVVSTLAISFAPSKITIRAGTTVRWENNSTMSHTVTSGKVGPGSGTLFNMPLNPGESVSFKFDKPGTYDYFCRVHVAVNMVGVITVTP